jgi:hypothetical protein
MPFFGRSYVDIDAVIVEVFHRGGPLREVIAMK